MVVPARLERATPAFGRRCSAPLSYGTKSQSQPAEAVVRPGGLEPPTALRSGAHDGYKPSALPVELWAQLSCACPYRKTGSHPGSSPGEAFSGTCVKWSGWLDSNQRPPASEAGTLAGLSYTLLALRREIESLSPVRQTGRLTRCVTERELPFFAEATKGSDPAKRVSAKQSRTATECALNALPLPIGVQ